MRTDRPRGVFAADGQDNTQLFVSSSRNPLQTPSHPVNAPRKAKPDTPTRQQLLRGVDAASSKLPQNAIVVTLVSTDAPTVGLAVTQVERLVVGRKRSFVVNRLEAMVMPWSSRNIS